MSAPKPHESQTIAPGLEDDELQAEASDREKAAGDTTVVTTLSFDEHDNGTQESPNS